jgi:NADH-quinone oxidoreductase E subunit
MKNFTEKSQQEALALLSRYPTREAALLPILHLAQREFGHIDEEAERAVAQLMQISPITVREASQFYFMYHKHPVGKYHLQVCHNISCTMMGAETLLDFIKEKLGVEVDQRTSDGLFSVERVECLACCDRAPALLINDRLFTGLTAVTLGQILADLQAGKPLEGE